jgi:[acyl-carrier-protein] S-malonyltransferase
MMVGVAFLYPGQGSQRVGMGAEILKRNPELFERYIALADAAAGLPIRQYSLEGPIETLTETQVAQPALFAVSLAMTEVAREAGLRPDFVAGHSLGEYTAAVASGALSPNDGMWLVAERGRLMAGIQAERPGAMAAIVGLSIDAVSELCSQASAAGLVAPANLNTPVQIVTSGEEAGIETLLDLARNAGAEKAIRLQVGAAFHSDLMKPVQASMAKAMETISWRDPDVPLVSNASGQLARTASEVRDALIAQIASPVLWVACVQTLIAAGCTTFLELGSGRVLTGLVRQIDPESDAFAADSPQKIATFAQQHVSLVGR